MPERSETERQAEYNRYIASKEWRERRKAALQRAEHRCQVCNSKQNLQVHHRTYSRFGNERDADLTVLCRRCHALFHDKGDASQKPPKKPKNPKDAKRLKSQKRKQRWQKRAHKHWEERPSTHERRRNLAAAVAREQREADSS